MGLGLGLVLEFLILLQKHGMLLLKQTLLKLLNTVLERESSTRVRLWVLALAVG